MINTVIHRSIYKTWGNISILIQDWLWVGENCEGGRREY
jgi:hypothetical protein